MSAAADLRAAAARLRALAEAATSGPWFQGVRADGAPMVHSEALVASGAEFTDVALPTTAGRDAAYIAAMSPPVALALADWLDTCAERAGVTSQTRLGHDPAERWWLEPALALVAALPTNGDLS